MANDDDAPDDQPGPVRQREVYMQGLADITPALPVSPDELEREALAAMDDEAAAYVAGGAGGESTLDANRSAFDDWAIVPRVLRNVAERERSVELFGREAAAPVVLAPVGVLSIVHEEAELAVAGAAADLGLPYALSTVSSTTMEDVADSARAARGAGPATEEGSETDDGTDTEPGDEDSEREDVTDDGGSTTAGGWFQLYPSADRDLTASLIERAEAAGYEALVVTVDTPLLAWRERDVERAYLPFLAGEGLANYLTDPAFLDRLDHDPDENELAAIREFVDVFGDPTLTWDDLDWIRERTDLPVIVKGILAPEDARLAVEHGADGIVVSNHGGRQVDRAIPALDALPDVVAAVEELESSPTILFDSGIRRGSDVLIALALGADAVLLGRPYVYGLALDGADGVREVCANLLADFDLTMGLAGRADVADLDRSVLRETE